MSCTPGRPWEGSSTRARRRGTQRPRTARTCGTRRGRTEEGRGRAVEGAQTERSPAEAAERTGRERQPEDRQTQVSDSRERRCRWCGDWRKCRWGCQDVFSTDKFSTTHAPGKAGGLPLLCQQRRLSYVHGICVLGQTLYSKALTSCAVIFKEIFVVFRETPQLWPKWKIGNNVLANKIFF